MKDRSAYHAAYRAANRDKARAYSAEWRANNKEKERAATARYRRENREALRASCRMLYRANVAERKRAAAEYKAANKHAYRAYSLNRRVRMAGGRLSAGIVAALLKRQGCACVYCKISLAAGYHIDHIMPLALGGKNVDTNVQLLCPPCNMAKGAQHPKAFAAVRVCA